MSGGVDSSVAAALLKKQGYGVVGVHMRCYNVDGCAEQDAEDARRTAEILGIPFYVFDFEKEYKEKVVEYMIDGYRRGLTPNPDVECNREIKFGLFLKKALEMGADYVATGHYVRIRSSANSESITNKRIANKKFVNSKEIRYSLMIARDLNKDQSYFLWTLTQEQLKYCLFPIGEYKKPEVRRLARRFGLLNADKKDSQGICFLGKVTFRGFLKDYIPEKKGLVLTTAGEKIGEHRGAAFYTIGQRHLGIRNMELGIRGKDTQPHYVIEKDVKKNTLVVAEGSDNPAFYRKEILLHDLNLIRPMIHDSKFMIPVYVRVRYRQPLVKARIMNYELGITDRSTKAKIHDSKFMILKFDQPVKFVAPGQSAVFYSKSGEMLGGGVIV